MVFVSHPVTGRLLERSSLKPIPNARVRFVPDISPRLEIAPEAVAYVADVRAVTDATGTVTNPSGGVVMLAEATAWTWTVWIDHDHFASRQLVSFFLTGPVDLQDVVPVGAAFTAAAVVFAESQADLPPGFVGYWIDAASNIRPVTR